MIMSRASRADNDSIDRLEMDFRHEAANAARCEKDFAELKKTTLVIPEVLWAKRRVLVMECKLFNWSQYDYIFINLYFARIYSH